MNWISRAVIVPGLVAALSACGGGTASVVDGADCYPADARKWISTASQESVGPSETHEPVAIYFDGSASMVGYIRGGTSNARPLADMVGMLPNLDGVTGSKVNLLRFDRKISPIAAGDLAQMQGESGYLCPAGNRDCDRQESHIDQVLSRIAAQEPGELSLIVSDLWLANSEVMTTDGVALSRPLSDIFASGRSIAVYGIESPYAGRVSDLPSGRTDLTAARRYLFLVAVGPVDRLNALRKSLATAPSASIARDLASGTAHYSLFSLEPTIEAAVGSQTFDLAPKSPLSKASFLPVRSKVRIPQFSLDRAAALRAGGAGQVPGARWSGVRPESILPGAVWQGEGKGSTKLYRQTGDACAAKGGDWREDGELPGGWAPDAAGYTLDPAALATLPSGKYLLVGTARRVSLTSPNPATQWMRDWSFSVSDEAQAVKRPVVPTLNLAETARLLEGSLLRSAERRPMVIGGFAVAVDIE